MGVISFILLTLFAGWIVYCLFLMENNRRKLKTTFNFTVIDFKKQEEYVAKRREELGIKRLELDPKSINTVRVQPEYLGRPQYEKVTEVE